MEGMLLALQPRVHGGEGGGPEPSACRIIGEEEPGGAFAGDRQKVEEAAEKHRRDPRERRRFHPRKNNPQGESRWRRRRS